MTPTLLLAILALLTVVLIGLASAIAVQIRSGPLSRARNPREDSAKAKAKKSRPTVLGAQAQSNETAEGSSDKLPRATGRKRQLRPASSAGGDESAAKRLLQSGVYASCEERLELAFESYSHGRISLDTYETMVRAEGARADRLQADLRAKELAGNASHGELDSFREEIETIRIAVKWCLDWSAARRAGSSQDSDSS